MHAVKVDSRKIMAAGLVIVAVFAAVAITVNLFYLGQIQSLVRNTTTTSVMELATARAHYLDECLASGQNSVKSLAHFIADVTPQEARDQVKDFISTHEAAAAWIRSKDGTTWCSSSETDLYDPALEDELFSPAMAGKTGSSEMYLGHAGERRILFYAPIVDAPVTAGPGTTATPADPGDVLGAVYVSYPADELQNSYGTAYSSAGATFVVDSSGTIVLDANRGADEAVQGSLSALINDNADSAQVSSLLAGIASDTSGSLVMTLDGADQFVFYTPISAKSGWSLVTILPLSVVESDGTQIVGITNQMVAVLAVAVGLFLENGSSVSDWMDVISIYVIPVGAFLAAVMFFWVCPRGFAKKQAEMGRKKPLGRWFDFMTRYVFVIITALVIVLGIFYGGIG